MVAGADKSSDKAAPSGETQSNAVTAPKAAAIEITPSLSVRELADLLSVSSVTVIKQLMRNGIMANINQIINYEAAAAVAASLGVETRLKVREAKVAAAEIKKRRLVGKEASGLQLRPPVVTIMGHVDHGKTRLLDAIRQTHVMDSEAGGITQHIGAYQVEVKGQKITFLDTPGHQAFTAMRARGAQITDIAILVVAADDGVMPQTLEAISHAKAAGVPIVVAINKIDKPGANPETVKQQLADAGLIIEEWGGDVVAVPVSAKEKKGISELLENLLIVAEMEDLKANPSAPPEGVVVEAGMDKTKGPLATVLIQSGTLKIGDTIVIGTAWGRVRAMFNDRGKPLKKAEPATPVVILGLDNVPQVGDVLKSVANEHDARALIQKRQADAQATLASQPVSLSNLFEQISAGSVKALNIILKTDVQGSIEPIKASLERLGTEEVRVKVIHIATGNITESDVMLAIASKGLIIGFNVTTELGAKRLAEKEGVSIRNYAVIYNIVDDVEKALKGMLAPTVVEVIEGRAEVRAVFSAGKKQQVAGVYVTEGKVTRGALARVRRKDQVVVESSVISLRRFKDNVNEVATGFESGVGLKDFNDFQVGDILEFYRTEERR